MTDWGTYANRYDKSMEREGSTKDRCWIYSGKL